MTEVTVIEPDVAEAAIPNLYEANGALKTCKTYGDAA